MIFPVIYPGTWFNLPDEPVSNNARVLISLLEDNYRDANIALNLHDAAYKLMFAEFEAPKSHELVDQEWQARVARYIRAEAEVKATKVLEQGLENENHIPWELGEEIRFLAELQIKQEDWAAGIQPRSYESATTFMHARSFLYAFDGFQKTLDKLKEVVDQAGIDLSPALDQFKASFEDVTEIRNSAHHLEDRAMGKGRGKQHATITFPESAPGLHIGPQVEKGVILSHAYNNRYGNTLYDGTYREIEVSTDSIIKLQAIFQNVLDAFSGSWTGSKTVFPG